MNDYQTVKDNQAYYIISLQEINVFLKFPFSVTFDTDGTCKMTCFESDEQRSKTRQDKL